MFAAIGAPHRAGIAAKARPGALGVAMIAICPVLMAHMVF